MLSVGVFNSLYPGTLKESIKRIKADGFTCVQLELCFKDIDTSIELLDKAKCKKIRDAFHEENLLIATINAEANLVHPDPVIRGRNINKIKTLIKFSHDLGCAYIVNEPGTFCPDHNWMYHPKNVTEEGYQEALEVVSDIVKYAYDYGAVYLVEAFMYHVTNSIEVMQRLFSDINHKSMGLLMDPVNYYDTNTIQDPDTLLNRLFDAMGDKIKVAHAKDCRITEEGDIDLLASGLGVLNYNRYVERLYKIDPNMPLIMEHVKEGDMQRAKQFVNNRLKEMGC